ncbi:MAG TPA: cytochrome c nitrite reductase small subunit [Ignavibacteria bacterium]|nr:cytochrome c nitrite reductase small subunit [Ignavibacteria bacterium]
MIKKFINIILPPENWKVPVIVICGVFTGTVFFILYIGNATSYISDKPETCINCHVMYPQYASWRVSSHSKVATCNDCHVPQDNIIKKYAFKASDGARHSFMFTFRLEPQVIKIKQAGINVVQDNCIRCHNNLINHTMYVKDERDEERLCWSCHQETPHGSVSSLSSFPDSKVPGLNPIIPDWLKKQLKK